MPKELNRPAWFVKACSGYSDLGKAEVVFDGKHHGIVKTAGGPTWAGRGFKPYYSPVRYQLLKKGQPFSQGRELVVGRPTKEQKLALKDILEVSDDLEDRVEILRKMREKK